jgi:hypothetical protein
LNKKNIFINLINFESILVGSKLLFILLYFILISINLIGQKHDNTWIIGYHGNGDGTIPNNIGATFLSFNDKKLSTKFNDISSTCVLGFSNSSFSDENGNLLFVSDGFNIYDQNLQVLENGDSINYGVVWQDYREASYPDVNHSIFFPMPGDDNQVIMIHRTASRAPKTGSIIYDKMNYTLIDKSKKRVILKNITFYKNQFLAYFYGAVRHANGRDWWIIQMEPVSNRHYFFLLDPNGVHFHHTQEIGTKIKDDNCNGNCVFNPDGTKVAFLNILLGIQVMDFDRCLGLFSNSILLPIISKYPWIGTVAFSASSRFLYCCSSERVIQYDLFDKEYYLKGDTVAYHNGVFPFGLSTYFCHIASAPDNKIYISSIGSSYYIHTIDQPEVKGIGCNVLQQNIKIKKVMYSFFPQFPNYRLGALIGSGCDTLFNHDRPSYTFEIHPNPVHDVLKLVHKQGELFQNFSFELYNIEGKKVLEEKLSFNQNQWDIPMKNNLSGIYIYRIIMNQMIVAQGKAILVR